MCFGSARFTSLLASVLLLCSALLPAPASAALVDYKINFTYGTGRSFSSLSGDILANVPVGGGALTRSDILSGNLTVVAPLSVGGPAQTYTVQFFYPSGGAYFQDVNTVFVASGNTLSFDFSPANLVSNPNNYGQVALWGTVTNSTLSSMLGATVPFLQLVNSSNPLYQSGIVWFNTVSPSPSTAVGFIAEPATLVTIGTTTALPAAVVPEPASVVLMLLGLASLTVAVRRRATRNSERLVRADR